MNLNYLPEKEGIYQIINLCTEKMYIGQSVNIRQRMKKHFTLLKNNKHENMELQQDIKNFPNDLRFNVLELTNKLKTRELYWMYYFEDQLYNSIPKWRHWGQKLHHKRAKQRVMKDKGFDIIEKM